MMYHQDWLMRQIEAISRFVFSVLLDKEPGSTIRLTEEAPTAGDPNPLGTKVAALVQEERFGAAEDLLFEAVAQGDPEALPVALRFYTALNQLPDETLERCGFPRDEILSGLTEVCAAYGYDLSVLE